MFIEGLNIAIGSWNSIAEELEIVRENETVFFVKTIRMTSNVITIALEVPNVRDIFIG